MSAPTVTKYWYDDVATVYEERYGEPLVADESWVRPIFETCEVSVACDTGLTAEEFTAGAEHAEVVERTAAVIAVMTHGVKAVGG